MKKLIILLACALFLCSCTATTKSVPKSAVTLDDSQYLIGLEPSELGLKFSATADMPFKLSPSDEALKAEGLEPKFAQSFMFNTVPKVRIYPTSSMSYLGCMQAVLVRMKQLGADKEKLDGVYVLNFQLYSSSDFKPGMYAKIYEMNVPYDELEKRVFYKGDDFVAVDLTDYMLGIAESTPITLEDHIAKRWPDGHPDTEYAYSVRDYVKENMKKLLRKSS